METVGFIGIGNLGLPIAKNLIQSGYKLKVYNRTRVKTKPLADLGATIVGTPAEAAESGGIVFSLVADDRALEEICTETLIQKLGEGGLHISMSTVSADVSRRLAKLHEKAGAAFVAAPVFARPEAAAARAGSVCISGATAQIRERAKPVLTAAVAKAIFDFWDDAGAANVVKLIGNFMIASSIELLAEALTLAEKNGLAPPAVHEMLTSTIFAAPVFQNYGRIIMGRNYEPASFRQVLGLKDVNLVLENARAANVPLPLANLVQNRMTSGVAKGLGDSDWASFADRVREDAGL